MENKLQKEPLKEYLIVYAENMMGGARIYNKIVKTYSKKDAYDKAKGYVIINIIEFDDIVNNNNETI